MNKMRAIHPGKILKGELLELNLSVRSFAQRLSVPPNRISSILNGERSITADTALRLARFFETSPELWLNLQSDYDLKIAMKEHSREINREVLPFSKTDERRAAT